MTSTLSIRGKTIIQTQTDVGGKVVADSSLIMYLDASNPESYPGSGTTWYDLTNYGTDGSITHATYFSTIPNYFQINDLGAANTLGIDFSITSNLTSTLTIEIWAKAPLSLPSFGTMFGWGNTVANTNYSVMWWDNQFTEGMGYSNQGGDLRGISLAQINNLNLLGNWHHYVYVMRSDVSYSNNKIYIDSNNQTLTQLLGSPSTLDFNNGNGRIGNTRNSTIYPMQYDCAIFKIYNRELTQSEITQNFNALKSRFGIF